MQKSNKLEVITDGAYSLADGVSGYAYALTYEILKGAPALDMNHGIATSSNDSESAEWEAINAALLAIEKQIKSNDIDIKALRVHCDNEGVVSAINDGSGNSARMSMYNDFLNNKGKLNALGVDVNVVKIKAHVNMAIASPEEKLHNLVDHAATSARISAQEHLFSPRKANIVSVVLPNESGLLTEKEQRKIANLILDSGSKIRFASCGYGKATRDNSPFLDEIYNYANKAGLKVNSLCKQVDWDDDKPTVTEGLDMSLLRRYRYEEKKTLPIGEVTQNASNRAAGVYSLLLYGPRSKERYNDKYHTGRISHASKLVINLSTRSGKGHAEHLGDWAIKLGALTDVRCVPSPKDMLNSLRAGIPIDKMGQVMTAPMSLRKKEEKVRLDAEKLRKAQGGRAKPKQANAPLETHETPKPIIASRQVTPNIKPKENNVPKQRNVRPNIPQGNLSGKELRAIQAKNIANESSGVSVSNVKGDGVDKPGGIKKLHEVLYQYSQELEPAQVYRKVKEALNNLGYHIDSVGEGILTELCDKKLASRIDCVLAINKHDWSTPEKQVRGVSDERPRIGNNKLSDNFRRR